MKSFEQFFKPFLSYGDSVVKILARKKFKGTFQLDTIARCYSNGMTPTDCADCVIRQYEIQR